MEIKVVISSGPIKVVHKIYESLYQASTCCEFKNGTKICDYDKLDEIAYKLSQYLSNKMEIEMKSKIKDFPSKPNNFSGWRIDCTHMESDPAEIDADTPDWVFPRKNHSDIQRRIYFQRYELDCYDIQVREDEENLFMIILDKHGFVTDYVYAFDSDPDEAIEKLKKYSWDKVENERQKEEKIRDEKRKILASEFDKILKHSVYFTIPKTRKCCRCKI